MCVGHCCFQTALHHHRPRRRRRHQHHEHDRTSRSQHPHQHNRNRYQHHHQHHHQHARHHLSRVCAFLINNHSAVFWGIVVCLIRVEDMQGV